MRKGSNISSFRFGWKFSFYSFLCFQFSVSRVLCKLEKGFDGNCNTRSCHTRSCHANGEKRESAIKLSFPLWEEIASEIALKSRKKIYVPCDKGYVGICVHSTWITGSFFYVKMAAGYTLYIYYLLPIFLRYVRISLLATTSYTN